MSKAAPDYLSNQEYDEALRLYYNGLDYTKAIKPIKHKKSWYNPIVAESMMLEGEEFERLDIPDRRVDHIVITNLGRVINTNTGTISAVWITKRSILVNIAGTSWIYEELYKDTNFKYDYETIKNNFIDNGWQIKKVKNYYNGKY
jgi:hypothetical protein